MTLPNHARVLVVGGGTAGCVVAGRLARDHRVAVLEAGPDYGPAGDAWPADLLDGCVLPTSHDWGYDSGRLTFDRCRVIGGCSAHNGCTQCVGWAGDYDAWAATGSPGWDAVTLAPHFQAAAQALQLRHFRENEIQPFQRAFIAAAARLGIPVRHDLDQLDAGVSVGCAPVNMTPEGVRKNSAFGYLDQVRDDGNLTVAAGMTVDRVILDGDRAVAVDVLLPDNRRHRIDADLIVIAAGAYGTPEVLLRSGIGPPGHLAEVGIAVRHPLEGVGANLHDHPSVQLEYAGTAELAADLAAFAATRLLPEEQAIAKLRSPFAGEAPYDLHVYPWIEPDDSLAHGWRVVIPIALLRPRSRGVVRLRSADPRVRAHVDHAYLTDNDDVAALVHGLAWARELNLAPYLGSELTAPAKERDLAARVRETHGHYWHPVGTCRMGPETDPGAVVDHTGKVHGLNRLYVADASVFPDVPRATTAWPTTVVGERIAVILKELL